MQQHVDLLSRSQSRDEDVVDDRFDGVFASAEFGELIADRMPGYMFGCDAVVEVELVGSRRVFRSR